MSSLKGLFAAKAIFDITCVGPNGEVRWAERVENLVTTPGKADSLNKYFKGSFYTAQWYLALKGAGAPNSDDTLASHPSWSEVTPYTGTRPLLVFTANAVENAGAGTAVLTSDVKTVSITTVGPTTVAGVGLTNAVSGTSGVLWNVADFAASRSVYAGDELRITAIITAE